MIERDIHPEPPKPPQRWHNAVRKLPGNQENDDKFISFPEKSDQGVIYSYMSLTKDDPATGLPEGIYISTTIILGSVSDYAPFVTPMLVEVKRLITQEPGETEETPVSAEIDPEMSALGATLNLANTVGLRVAALTKSKMMVFGIQPVKIDDLKGSTRIT